MSSPTRRISCALLCFVVPIATGAPWHVVEFTSYREPTIGLIMPGSRVRVPPFSHPISRLFSTFRTSAVRLLANRLLPVDAEGCSRDDVLPAHGLPNGSDVRFHRALEPRRVHREHRRRPVAMLFRDQQRVASDHQVPAHPRCGGPCTVCDSESPAGGAQARRRTVISSKAERVNRRRCE